MQSRSVNFICRYKSNTKGYRNINGISKLMLYFSLPQLPPYIMYTHTNKRNNLSVKIKLNKAAA